jgi:protein subunit release factor A
MKNYKHIKRKIKNYKHIKQKIKNYKHIKHKIKNYKHIKQKNWSCSLKKMWNNWHKNLHVKQGNYETTDIWILNDISSSLSNKPHIPL